MNKFIRLMIMIILVLGIIFVAKSQAAGANQAAGPGPAFKDDQRQSASADRNEDCTNTNNDKNNKNKCKGSVKPPPREILIPVTGEYSVGGFCTVSITLIDPAIKLEATIQTPLPLELPDTVQGIRQGCLLTYYASGQRIDDLSATSGTATICFAAIPQKQMVIYFYDQYSITPQWTALPTTVQNGVACALSVQSGVYVATFQKS